MEKPKFSGTQIEYLLWATGTRIPEVNKQIVNRINRGEIPLAMVDTVRDEVVPMYLANVITTMVKALEGTNSRYPVGKMIGKAHRHYLKKEKKDEV